MRRGEHRRTRRRRATRDLTVRSRDTSGLRDALLTGSFDSGALDIGAEPRSTVLSIFEAALAAVDPAHAVRRTLLREGATLFIGDETIELGALKHVFIIALGKAAPAMARSAWEVLTGIDRTLLVISDHDEPLPTGSVMRAGHPVPTAASVRAASAALELAGTAGPDDMVICLISGGGSSLAEIPAPGLHLEDVAATVRLLLKSGVPIEEMNVVRHHLSAFKGGRLGESARPARLATLVLSDIAGNPLSSIASGPTVADPSTFSDAIRVLTNHALLDTVPADVRAHLQRGVDGLVAETPTLRLAGQTAVVVADNATALDAGVEAAENAGFSASIAPAALTGEAARMALRCLETHDAGVTLFGGETTVIVAGDGEGGRNQEAALAAAVEIDGRQGITFATLATDGVDGPTGAAGAIVDGGTAGRGRAAGLDPLDHLRRNDSHPFLKATRDLLVTGPTGTNVGDIWAVVRT